MSNAPKNNDINENGSDPFNELSFTLDDFEVVKVAQWQPRALRRHHSISGYMHESVGAISRATVRRFTK